MPKTFYVGIKGVIVSDSKALILKSSDDDRWDLPGGRINDSEAVEEALSRELREELPSIGNFKIGNLLNVFRLDHDLTSGNGLVLIYFKVTADKFDIQLSDEHSDFAWVDGEEIDTYKLEDGFKDAVKLALS